MRLSAWRIVKANWAATAFSGEGAKQFGGRWNSAGVPAVYTADSLALAILEILVNVDDEAALATFVSFEVTMDEDLVTPIDVAELPSDWRKMSSPESPRRTGSTQALGDAWIRAAETPVLSVPSAVVPTARNYVLNPLHPAFARIEIGPERRVEIDPRLVRPGRSGHR